MATGNARASTSNARSLVDGTLIANIVKDYIMTTEYFPQLNKVAKGQMDIVAVVMGIFQVESHFKIDAQAGKSSYSTKKGTSAAAVAADIKAKTGRDVSIGDPNQALIFKGLGLGQCMGWYLIRGLRSSQEMHDNPKFSSLCSSLGLLVNFGENPLAAFRDKTVTPNGRGPADTKGLRASIVASLVVLEMKLKQKYSAGKSVNEWVYSAVRAYLGKGADAFGTTPEKYSAWVAQAASKYSQGRGATEVAAYSDTSDSAKTTNSGETSRGGAGPIVAFQYCPQESETAG